MPKRTFCHSVLRIENFVVEKPKTKNCQNFEISHKCDPTSKNISSYTNDKINVRGELKGKSCEELVKSLNSLRDVIGSKY
jgi:hypothetical protein